MDIFPGRPTLHHTFLSFDFILLVQYSSLHTTSSVIVVNVTARRHWGLSRTMDSDIHRDGIGARYAIVEQVQIAQVEVRYQLLFISVKPIDSLPPFELV